MNAKIHFFLKKKKTNTVLDKRELSKQTVTHLETAS